MGKLFVSIPKMQAGAASAETHGEVVRGGTHRAIGSWSGRKWIFPGAVSTLIVATVGFASFHWNATKVVAPQGASASIDNSILRLSGSKTFASVLAPQLVKAWLVSIGTSDVQETDRVDDRNQVVESVISAKLNGAPVAVEVKGGGSATAFEDMAAGNADIGITSREINSSELIRLKSLGDMHSQASEHVLGVEGIAVIVPRSNTVSSLSRSTLRKIFTGQITNWSAVGMARVPVHLYARDKNSRANNRFASLILGDDPIANAKLYADSAKLESDVAADPGGIGVVSMAYVKDTRLVSISDQGVAPLGQQLYLYTAARTQAAMDFVRFAMSPQGQDIVRQTGFVPASGEVSVASSNSAAVAPLRVSAGDNPVTQSFSASPVPPGFTPSNVSAVVPERETDSANPPPRPPTITASLQAPPPAPPAITASLQPPTPAASQPTPPAVEATPPPPAPARTVSPPVVNVAPLPPPGPPPPTSAVAINSHAVIAGDYPAISMRRQDQGTVVIKYQVRENGSVGDCSVTAGSGKTQLDDAACAIVRRRWKFKPATRDGKPVAEFLTAEVVFRLGDLVKEPKPTIMALLAPPPPRPAAPEPKVPTDPRMPVPPVAITSHAVMLDEYPVLSRTLQEQGNVVVKYLVREDGSVGECSVMTSSGISRLDDAACALVKRRWKFRPATQEGKPIAQSLSAEVVFRLK